MRKPLLLTALMLSLVSFVFAQTKEIKGRVLDATTGDPVEGVSVLSDTKKTTTTKADGTYTIQVSPATKTLIFSHISFVTQTIDVKDALTIDVRLQPSNVAMDDVVVIGYGTQKNLTLPAPFPN